MSNTYFTSFQAIDLNPLNAVYWANRSIANLRMENFGYALSGWVNKSIHFVSDSKIIDLLREQINNFAPTCLVRCVGNFRDTRTLFG